MLAQGSLRFILPPLLVVLVLAYFQVYLIYVPLLGFTIYLIWFFRDPSRSIKLDKDLLYAPADGLVKEIIAENDGTLKIAIRMSPFNVHLNRAPYEGVVRHIEYKPGKHQSVYFAGAEEKNEQNLIEIDTKEFELSILQITGAFARRIECWVKKEDNLTQGQKIGIIRFGSQTNMLCKPKNIDTIAVLPIVDVDQPVYAGLTAIAEVKRK